jgi:hypothetical protein
MRFVGVAKPQLGADIEAVGWLRRRIEANRNRPLAHFALAAALGVLGTLDEARAAARAGLALNPGFIIRRLRAAAKSTDNPNFLAGLERTCEGMRLAGVPERTSVPEDQQVLIVLPAYAIPPSASAARCGSSATAMTARPGDRQHRSSTNVRSRMLLTDFACRPSAVATLPRQTAF